MEISKMKMYQIKFDDNGSPNIEIPGKCWTYSPGKNTWNELEMGQEFEEYLSVIDSPKEINVALKNAMNAWNGQLPEYCILYTESDKDKINIILSLSTVLPLPGNTMHLIHWLD